MSRLRQEDLEFTFYRSSGPGGQKKNTTESAVRLRHRPTGMIVTATRHRSQHRNKAEAIAELEERLARRYQRRKPRIPTRVSRAAQEKRLESKRNLSRTKKLRKPPSRWD